MTWQDITVPIREALLTFDGNPAVPALRQRTGPGHPARPDGMSDAR